MVRAAVHTRKIVTREQATASHFYFRPTVDLPAQETDRASSTSNAANHSPWRARVWVSLYRFPSRNFRTSLTAREKPDTGLISKISRSFVTKTSSPLRLSNDATFRRRNTTPDSGLSMYPTPSSVK
jgi:hypothetical protein